MSLVLLLRFLHIFSAIAFVGGILARQVVRALAGRMMVQGTGDVRMFADLNVAAGRIENVLVIPGNMAVIVFGVLLALVTRAPIFGFLQGAQQNWLLATMVLLVIGSAAVPLIFVPRGKLFDAALQRAVQQGTFTPELRAIYHDPVVGAVHLLEIGLVVAVLLLMVFKPF